jgi:hypothetical protein
MKNAMFAVCLLVVIAAAWLLVVGLRPTPAADAPRPPAAEVGRYQFGTDGRGNAVYLFDTATGQMWKPVLKEETVEWAEHIRPVKKK